MCVAFGSTSIMTLPVGLQPAGAGPITVGPGGGGKEAVSGGTIGVPPMLKIDTVTLQPVQAGFQGIMVGGAPGPGGGVAMPPSQAISHTPVRVLVVKIV